MDINRRRLWMDNRNFPERRGLRPSFVAGVMEFLDVARNTDDYLRHGKIRCPCEKCECVKIQDLENVELHLYKKGFMPNYYVWYNHGEPWDLQQQLQIRKNIHGARSSSVVEPDQAPPGFTTPLGQGQDGNLSVPTPNQPPLGRPRGRPRKRKSFSALTEVPPVTATETPAVPPPNVSPLGSSKDTPLEMPCDEDEGEHIETKINLNPLLRLKKPPESPCRKECSPYALEKSKTLIPQVMSMLVSHLTSGSSQNIDAMVDHANKAFMTLDWLKADYGSFYSDVKDFITYHYDLLTTERDKDMQPFLELKTRYNDAMVCANDLEKNILHTQANIQTAKEKKEPLKRRIAEAMDIIDRLKKEVADIERDEKVLKTMKRKYVAAHEIAQVEAQKLRSQMEEAECAIEQRKNAALNGIEPTTRRLQSIHS